MNLRPDYAHTESLPILHGNGNSSNKIASDPCSLA